MMEVKLASASVDVCGYPKYSGSDIIGYYKDKKDVYDSGGECVYPSGEGLIAAGGTCSTGLPTCSGDISGALDGTIFTNAITGSFTKGQTDLAAAGYGSATTYGPLDNSLHEDWYLLADPFSDDLDILDLNTTPGAARADEFDDLIYPCTINKIRIRFKNTGYPVRLKIEVEKKTFDRSDSSEIDRDTESVILSTHDTWSSYIDLEPPSAYTGVVIDRSRIYVPWTA